MWCSELSFSLLLFAILTTIEAEGNLTACEQKEKHITNLDLAKEVITKAKDIHPSCDNDDGNTTECGIKEKVSALLNIVTNLIDDAKLNFTTCEEQKTMETIVIRNVTKIEIQRVEVHKKPIDCSEILENGHNESGIYTIWPKNRVLGSKAVDVYCDMDTDGGGWTVIQRRGNVSEKVDFFRSWNDYKNGFGNLLEEFWIGNDNIFALTNQKDYTLRFDMDSVDKEYRYAAYSSFYVEDENDGYLLHYGDYTGTAGDGMGNMKDTKFSAYDKSNDRNFGSCSRTKSGGWWYSDCGDSNPNGINLPGGTDNEQYMNWLPFTQNDSLLEIEMKIRAENKD